jgi:hypothetical protein
MSEDLRVLREILQRELETINAYERMLDRVSDPALRKIIEHVTDEEREHVSEMYELIVERDVEQAARAVKSRAQLVDMALLTEGGRPAGTAAATAGLGGELIISGARAAEAGPAALPPTIFPDGDWSVGPLKGRST